MAQNHELESVTFHEVFGAAKRLVGQRKRLQRQLTEAHKRELQNRFAAYIQEHKIDLFDEVTNGATTIVLCDPHNPENMKSALRVAAWYLGEMKHNVYMRNMSDHAKPRIASLKKE